MAKQLNVALDFTANTTQAKQQIQELQQLLTKVAYSTDLGVNPEQMQKASAAAKELAIHLNEAYNTSTGNYDLSKLNASLARSKTSVTELSNGLLQAGATGQQAFIKLAQSIAAADQPMITLNARLQDFLTTVKNTVKWQISSSMIHGVMGALQGAYGYAQDLNKSLNDIRIVTGHNIDYMDKFADKANKAAKALSTSTLNYTDASLIYYQQGLSDQEVEDRTAVTIKMANAAGESADKVSEQLTAVWNNFYDGSQSLEYYADVMTALGAATASSTDEIAEGLEKFAAVSNTVGLSYEYATSALATVTATTRQSADVVGTAFKTLFARIQDLELGETLDDGTTLGKYSQALDAVGVEIKDATGGLRDMDDILSDLGEKWNSFDAEGNPLISKDAKVALAQTVAGVRQYTQLMALMDNWDFMKENLETARNATGTLTEQQKIYEESWEAANKRLKASFQSLYQDLIDDKFFIKFTDFLSDMIDGVDSFVDKVGGLKTIMIGILSLVTNLLSSRIQPAIDNIINNIQVMAGGANKVYSKIRNEMNEQINIVSNKYNLSDYDKQSLQNVSQLNIMKQKLADQTDRLSDSERRLAEITIQGFEMSQQEILKTTKQLSEYKTQVQELQEAIPDGGIDYSNKRSSYIKALEKGANNQTASEINTSNNTTEIQILQQNLKALSDAAFNAEVAVDGSIKTISQKFMELGQAGQEQVVQGSEAFSDLISQLSPFSAELDKLSNNSIQSQTAIKGMKREIEVLGGSLPETIRNSEAVNNAFKAIETAQGPKELKKAIIELQTALKNTEINGKNVNQVLSQLGVKKQDINLIVNGYKEISTQEEKLINQQKDLNNQLNNFNPKHLGTIAENFVRLTSVSMSAVMSINSFKAGIESLTDPDLSGWEKFSSAIMSFSFAFGSLKSTISGSMEIFNNLRTSLYSNYTTMMLTAEGTEAAAAAKIHHEAVTWLQCAAEQVHKGILDQESFALGLVNLGFKKDIAAKIADAAATGGLSAAMKVLNAELKTTIVSLLATLGPILVVIAAVAALGFAIYTAIKRSQAFEAELKQSSKDLAELKNNLNNVNSEVQKVNSSLDGLSSKYDAFKDLTYGTTEWREALYEVNNEVQDLIDNYNKAADASDQLIEGVDYYRDQYNALHLTESGTAKIKEQNITTQNNAQTAVNAQNYRNEQLQLQKDKMTLASNTNYLANHQPAETTTKTVTIVVPDVQAFGGSTGSTTTLSYEKTETKTPSHGYNINAGNGAFGGAGPNMSTTPKYQYDAALTQADIDRIIKAATENIEFDFGSVDDLINEGGLSEEAAKLVASSSETQKALQKLTTETSRLADSYANDILNDLLARGLDLSGYDEQYRMGVGKAIAQDTLDYQQQIMKSRASNSGNELTQSEVSDYLTGLGYFVEAVDTNDFQNFISGNQVLTVKLQDENGGIIENSDTSFSYKSLLEGFALQQAQEEALGWQDNYYDEQGYTEQAHNAVQDIQGAWGEQNFNSDLIQAQGENFGGGAMPEEIERLSNFLSENAGSFSEIVGVSEEDIELWSKSVKNLTDNFELLDRAIREDDVGAINELREAMGSLGTHGQELIDKLSKAWDDGSNKIKDYSSYWEGVASDSVSWSGEVQEALDDFVDKNADVLSDLAGVSKDTFKQLYKDNKGYAKKVGKLLPGVVKGNKKDLLQLTKDTYTAFYTTEQNIETITKNIEKSTNKDLKDAFAGFEDTSAFIENQFSILQKAADKLTNDPLNFDAGPAIQALNFLIQTLGLTKTQAQDLAAAFSLSAEITENPTEQPGVEKAAVYTNNLDRHGHHLDPPQSVEVDVTDYMTLPTVTAINGLGDKFEGKLIEKGPKNPQPTSGDGGGSSGGGGGDSYTPPPPKEYDDEIERYHVIKQQIEDLEEIMDHLAKAKDRAFGTSKLEIMDQEIEKYGEMIDLQNQYLAEIEDYWKKDRDLIASYGAIFDETGVIINYDEIMKRQIDKYNASIGKNEEADDAAEEAYNDFLEALDQYEETNNLRQEELEKLYDLQTELADVIFEKTQYKIEIKIAVKDDELEYLEYLLSKIEDDAYAAAEAIALMGEKAENALEKTKIYSEGLMELLSNHGINSLEELDNLSVDDLKAKEFTEDEIDQIREWKTSILEANQELLEMRNTIQEKVLDSFDQFSEDLEDQMELFEHYQTILESVKDITSLLGTELTKSSKEVIRNLNRAMLDNNINSLASQKTVLETYQEQQKQAQAAYDHAKEINDTESIRQWEETLSEINDKVNEAEENFLDIWQETLEQARDIYEEEMDNIAKDFEEGISPIYGAIDVLQDTIGRAREINEQYLEDYEKTYELNKLAREIQGSIDNTDIISNKKKLSALQDEINRKLKDGTKMSEYDLKILQQKYELELAHQALDDAKNGNERVRLARDGNGNWGYIYTADEDKIAEAEQNYEDKLKAMQDANKEYLQTLEDNILTLQQTWQQAISEINLSYANGEITKAEQEVRIAEINEYYATRMEQLKGEYEKMFSNSQEFAERFQKYFKDVNLDIASSFDKTSLAIKTGYTSLTELFEGFWRSHDSYLTSATMLLEQYREKLSEVSSVAGTISSAFASEANGWAINITGNSKDVVADVEKIAKNTTDSFNKVLETASDFEQMYADRLDEIIKKNEDLVTSMREMIAALSGLETATFETNRDAINNLSTTTPNNRASTMRNSETFNTYSLEQNENSLMAVQSSLINAIDNFKPIEIDKTVSLADSYLESLDIDKILQYISSSVSVLVNQLGGLKSFIISTPVEHTFEQTVNINADFPNATDSSEILEAFDIMEEEASQFANKKSI